MADATFEDDAERPLSLGVTDADDLRIVATLVQDAIFPVTEMKWQPALRRFSLLLNRFRWEDRADAERLNRPYERVQSLLLVSDVAKVASQGIDRTDHETILSLIDLVFLPGEDGTGRLELVLAGDGAIALDVESLNIWLRDVSRPYLAPSRRAPGHGD